MATIWHPTPPTKWSTGLADAYKDEMEKLDRFHAASRTVDQQRVDATIGADKIAASIKDLGTISKFSKTAADAWDKRKQADFVGDFRELDTVDKDTIKQTIKTEIDLTEDSVNVIETLKKALKKDGKELQPETLKFLEQNTARNSFRLRRLVGWDSIRYSIPELDQRLNSDEQGPLQGAYEKAKLTGQVGDFYRNDIHGKLKRLGFDKKYIAANFKDEITRIAETEGALASLDYQNVQRTAEVAQDVQTIRNLQLQNDESRPDMTAFAIQKMSQERGKLPTAVFLKRLLKDGTINESVIDEMEAGATVKYDAGPTGKYIFDPKLLAYIRSGATEFKEHQLATKVAKAESNAGDLLVELWKPRNKSKYQTQEQWNKAIQPLKGIVSPKTWTKLEGQNLAAQGNAEYQRYLNLYANHIKNGTLDQKITEIEAIPNTASRDFLLEIANRDKKWKDDAGEAYSEEGLESLATAVRVGQSAFDKDKSITSQKDRIIAADILSFKRQDVSKRIAAQYKDGVFTENLNIAKDSAEAVEAYKLANGWGLKSQEGEVATGKFALIPDGNGNFTWGNYFGDDLVTNNYDHSLNTSNRSAIYDQKFNAEPDKAKRQGKVEGIFSNNQLIGFLTTGHVNEDMQYIRSREVEPMSDLLEKSFKALIKSAETNPSHKAIVERYNIKEYNETTPTPDRILLKKLNESIENGTGISKSQGIDLKFIFKHYGPEAFTPKQLSRLLDVVDTAPIMGQAVMDTKINQFRRAGISEEAIDKWIEDEIRKRKEKELAEKTNTYV